MPKDLNVNVNGMEGLTDVQLLNRIRNLDAQIQPLLKAAEEADNEPEGNKLH
ncbi:hypothetical protein [Phyllobacterium sp. SB3]|uniref:hypothetical protein n=1 Tax=Phyllobacterium sp. SB3 TaxID=3156073 RepID=UPI0032AF0B27